MYRMYLISIEQNERDMITNNAQTGWSNKMIWYTNSSMLNDKQIKIKLNIQT